VREQISEGLSEAANNLCGFTPSGLARTAQFTDAVLALVRQALQSQAARLQRMEGVAASMGVRMAQLADDHKATGRPILVRPGKPEGRHFCGLVLGLPDYSRFIVDFLELFRRNISAV